MIPNVTKFSDLFPTAGPTGGVGSSAPVLATNPAWDADVKPGRHRRSKGPSRITGYLHTTGPDGGYRGMYVTATTTVLDYVKANMLAVSYDTISFEIVRGERTARVYAHYNLIIGSRLLAEIDAATIPEV